MNTRYYPIIILLIVILVWIGFSLVSPADTSTELLEHTLYYRVEKIIDGDTIRISRNTLEDTVRLLGIDTPEIASSYRAQECSGQEASAYLHDILPVGSSVSIQTDPSQSIRDRYDRLIAYVIREDGLLVNQEMIIAGYAYEYTYQRAYQYQKEFQKSEKQAREARRGLWSMCKEI